MTTLAILYHVTIGYDFKNDTAPYTCGSWEGAKRFVEKQIQRGDVCWYSIEELSYHPCHEDDIGGQLYMGLGRMEYKEIKEREDKE